MKEIRTIKMVEVTDVKFVADDGTEFIGENAERECRDYERTCDAKRVEKAFQRLDITELKMPFITWFDDELAFYKVQLNSKSDFTALTDYFEVVRDCYNYIEAPTSYPYTMIVYNGAEYVCEYTRDIKAEMQKALEQFN